jgi:hypothetical protein
MNIASQIRAKQAELQQDAAKARQEMENQEHSKVIEDVNNFITKLIKGSHTAYNNSDSVVFEYISENVLKRAVETLEKMYADSGLTFKYLYARSDVRSFGYITISWD